MPKKFYNILLINNEIEFYSHIQFSFEHLIESISPILPGERKNKQLSDLKSFRKQA